MANQSDRFTIVISNSDQVLGPQLVLPSFRPISLFEIEDDYDQLVLEVKRSIHDDFIQEEMVNFLGAFHDALVVQDVKPLMDYFVLNHGGMVNFEQIQPAFEALDSLITRLNDNDRMMN